MAIALDFPKSEIAKVRSPELDTPSEIVKLDREVKSCS